MMGAAGVAPLLGRTASAEPGAPERPNILFCIADDWSWPHAGAYGDKAIQTPTFDRLAAEGVLFANAFVATPSCTPSRGSILTGRYPHQLEDGGNLWSRLDKKFAVFPDLLEAAGYRIGCAGKGWGPGTIEGTGRTRNPAGASVRDFAQFLRSVPPGEPFCFWFGSHDPHRPYDPGSGKRAGIPAESIVVPPFLPDDPAVRSDIADYYFEVQRFDRDVGRVIEALHAAGRAANTLVVMTSDNGLPFPRAKANLYEYGVHMPLAVRWPARLKGGRMVEQMVSFPDFAPTFLQAAGVAVPPEMTGRSFLSLLLGEGRDEPARDRVFLERERHAWCRADGLGYPCRAIRTQEFLYVRNLAPDRWPAGDPPAYGDVDGGPSKSLLLDGRNDATHAPFFEGAFAKRPSQELFDLRTDPATVRNVAAQPEYAATVRRLAAEVDAWMAATGDPRSRGGGEEFDRYPYVGRGSSPAAKGSKAGRK